MPESVSTSPVATPGRSKSRALIIQPNMAARTVWLLRRAVMAAFEDNCFSIAKGAAYSFLFCLFPILTTLGSILVHARAQEIVRVIANFIEQVLPPGTEQLILSRLLEQTGKPVPLSIVAILFALWAGSSAMLSLMEGFQAAYRIPSGRPILKQRAMAIFLVLIAAFPAVAASSLILFGNRFEFAFTHWIGMSPGTNEIRTPVRILWHIARYVLAFCTTTFVTGLLYYFGPNHRPEVKCAEGTPSSRFMRVWPGAFLATVLWLGATAGFAWYINHIGRISHYQFVYGSLGTGIVLLIWLYVVSVIALVGCEFNAERERLDAMPSV